MAPSYISQRLIPLTERQEWAQTLDGIPHSFAHTWENCHAMSFTTGYPTFLYCCEGPEGRVVCPIAERPCGEYVEAVTPYGFSGFTGIGNIQDFPAIWIEFAKSQDWVTAYVTLNPLFYKSWFTDPAQVRTHNSLYILDLNLSEGAVMQGLRKSRRQSLMRWLNEGVVTITDRNRLKEFILHNHDVFLLRKNASPTYRFSSPTLELLCSAKNIYMVGAERAGSIECAIVCAHTCFSADYLLNISNLEGAFHSTGLLWNTVRFLQERAVPVLNLGGGVSPGDGISEFKRSLGGVPTPLRSSRQIFRPTIYMALCAQAGVNPHNETGFFPPYQNPSLRVGVH